MSIETLMEAVRDITVNMSIAPTTLWKEVADKLDKHNYPPEDFVWFCTFKVGGGGSPVIFRRANLANSDKLWAEFTEYMSTLEEKTKESLIYHRKTYEELRESFGPRTLLMGDILSLPPEVRCDLALRDLDNYQEVLQEYMDEALYKIRGNSYLKDNLKFLKLYIEHGEVV